jgi:hypothetical protein
MAKRFLKLYIPELIQLNELTEWRSWSCRRLAWYASIRVQYSAMLASNLNNLNRCNEFHGWIKWHVRPKNSLDKANPGFPTPRKMFDSDTAYS